MYVATNAVLGGTSNTADDSIWHVGNLRFYNDSAFYAKLYTEKSVSIPTLSVEVDGGSVDCHNPGAFALDDNDKGYCVSSYTIKDMPNRDLVSIFLKSDDINNSDFYRSNKDKVYSNLGHANGMAYYDNALYVMTYRRDNDPSKVRKNIVKLSMAGEELAVYTTEVFIGGISHYKGNQFILVDYNDTRAPTHYSKTPKFYIGYFDDTTHSFKIVKTFSVKNPTFIEGDSALQDIHYDLAFGLYFVALSDTDYMYRVLPENVEKAANTGEVINPDEKYVFGGMGELETFYISQSGKMYAVDGGTTDALDVITTLGFYK